MNVNKCPYCFRPAGTWLKDPILLPNGCPNEWVSDTETTFIADITQRIHKGFDQVCEPEVQEIQDCLKQAEIDNSITPLTTWSPLSLSGKFQITGKHIWEMRTSVEKLLTLFGLTKTDYFNYDESGNLITQYGGGKVEWTDPITTSTDLKKFQVKYIHIEDLRHYIRVLKLERWDVSPTGVLIPDYFGYTSVLGDLGNWSGWQGKYPYESDGVPYSLYTLVPNGLYWSLSGGLPLIGYAEKTGYFEIIGKKLKSTLTTKGVVVSQGITPPPLGWGAGWDYPYAYYNNHLVSDGYTIPGTSSDIINYGLGISLRNQLPKYIPIITSNNNFSCIISSVSCTPSHSVIRIFNNDYNFTEYPKLTITISMDTGIPSPGPTAQYCLEYGATSRYEVFTPGITYIGNNVYDKRLITTLIDGQITADLWTEISDRLKNTYYTLDSEGNKIPSMICVSAYSIKVSINKNGGGGRGLDYRAASEPGSASYTSANFIFEIDDIGITNKP